MARKIYIGNSDFATIVQNGGLLVDKSLLIRDIIEDTSGAILITRPRRWGKTLNMSMLQYFFSDIANGVVTKGMFDKLNIARIDNGEYIKKYQGKYPVIFFSFKEIKETSFVQSVKKMGVFVSRMFSMYDYLITSDKLQDYQKKIFGKYLTRDIAQEDIEISFSLLCEMLYKHHNQKVVILMDEYDTPLNEAYMLGYIDELTRIMHNLMSNAFKDNPYLFKGVLTGITRISKDSMLSGLNNLQVYSNFSDEYKDCFGFTDVELDYLFREQGMDRQEQMVKQWYNGYNFAGVTIYNPWSILSCLKNEGKFSKYWVNTASTTLIDVLLKKHSSSVQAQMLELINGGAIDVMVNQHVVFNDLDKSPQMLWSMLLFTGYLTTYGEYREDTMTTAIHCKLKVPNIEIGVIFKEFYYNNLEQYFGNVYNSFLKNLITGNIDQFETQLNQYLITAISLRDTARYAENFYHGLILGLVSSLMESHRVESNRESGLGFPDVMIMPLPVSKYDIGFVMEFKQSAIFDEEKLDSLANEALEQIDAKQYVAELKTHSNIKKIIKMGLAFSNKRVKIVTKVVL